MFKIKAYVLKQNWVKTVNIKYISSSDFCPPPPYPERPGERGDCVLAGGVCGHGIHVAHAGDARRAREADDGAAPPALVAVLAHVLEGSLDHQVRTFLKLTKQLCIVLPIISERLRETSASIQREAGDGNSRNFLQREFNEQATLRK